MKVGEGSSPVSKGEIGVGVEKRSDVLRISDF